ncbi:MAG: Holliday junction branch migration protein RuvA [Ilumatobacteraceae bacterium]
MIGSLRGKVLERNSNSTALIEVASIGYLVHVTPRTLAELEPTSSAFMYVYEHLREDAHTLYAFLERDERDSFETLIATHGIGPAMAMAILAIHSPRSLVDIVATGDLGSLTLVPGVGRKTAERLLIELKGRLNMPMIDDSREHSGGSSFMVADVREALAGLGYGNDEIRDVLRQLPAAESAEQLLRQALNSLGVRRA